MVIVHLPGIYISRLIMIAHLPGIYISRLKMIAHLPGIYISRLEMIAHLPGIYISRLIMIAHLPGIHHTVFSLQLNFFHSPVFQGFLDKLHEFVRYLVYFDKAYYPALQEHIFIFVVNPWYSYIFRLVLLSLMICWSVYCISPIPLVPLWHPFCSSQNSPRLISE